MVSSCPLHLSPRTRHLALCLHIPHHLHCVSTSPHPAVLRVAEEYVYWFEPRKNAIVRNRKSVGNLPSVAVTGVEGVTDFVVTLSHYPPSEPTTASPVLGSPCVLGVHHCSLPHPLQAAVSLPACKLTASTGVLTSPTWQPTGHRLTSVPVRMASFLTTCKGVRRLPVHNLRSSAGTASSVSHQHTSAMATKTALMVPMRVHTLPVSGCQHPVWHGGVPPVCPVNRPL